jgi:nitric oxide reductase activation protein
MQISPPSGASGGQVGGMPGGQPGQLSPEEMQELKDFIDNLPPEARAELERRAREALRDLERQIGEEMQGKLNDPSRRPQNAQSAQNSPPGAGNGRNGQKGRPRPVSMKQEAQDRLDRQDAPFSPPQTIDPPDKVNRAKTGPEEDPFRTILTKNYKNYSDSRSEVAPQISRFEQRARAIFKERKMQQWQSDRKSGQSVDIRKRITEVGKGVHPVQSRAWEQRLTPSEKDFAIALLVDLSGSMSGQKIEQAFKGAIVLTEPLKRLGITNGVFGFNSQLFVYKDFKQDLTPAVRARMGTMLEEARSGMNGSTDDGWALTHVSNWLEQLKAQQKFIIVLTDGESSPSMEHAGPQYQLQTVLDRIRENTGQKLIGLGIGHGTGFVNEAYPNGEGDIDVNELPEKLADLLEKIITDSDRFRR